MSGLISAARKLYGHLPPFTRDAAASLYGHYLKWWRYGDGADEIVQDALARDRWSEAQWRRWRDRKLVEILHRAATRVPYYRAYWQERRAEGDARSWEDLKNWPLLDKEALRRDPRAFVADDVSVRSLFQLTTSGTSGTPITTWRSRRTMRAWYALFEARARHWYGVDRHMPWAILGGQIVTPAAQEKPPFSVWNAGLRQLYMSTLHLAPGNAADYIAAMERYGVRHLYGYASSMYALACMIRDEGVRAPRLLVAVSNAEPLFPHQRALIGEVFDCPVRDTYGMSEIVAAASECEYGSMHMWPEAGIVEVLDDHGQAAPRGESGELACTGLLNPDMPLIRYRVGDRGALASSGREACLCGRRLPRIEKIEGRTSDNLVTADGRRVFWLNPVFYGLPVREGQIVQEDVGALRVLVVPDGAFDDRNERLLVARLRERMGDIRVEVRRVREIPRGADGKLKLVVNRVEAGR